MTILPASTSIFRSIWQIYARENKEQDFNEDSEAATHHASNVNETPHNTSSPNISGNDLNLELSSRSSINVDEDDDNISRERPSYQAVLESGVRLLEAANEHLILLQKFNV
ncbi:uncharacterized protein ACNLHF_028464 [Anomaloglossus baeobatrachus]